MSSTYSTNLAIELIGTGDQAGSWGNTTNTNLGTLIEQAISGYVTQAVSTGTDTTITIPNGATGVARNMYIELTGTGGTNTNLIVPANKKLYFIYNNSTGAVTVKVSGQTGVSVPTGKKMVLVSDGTDIVNGLNYIADFGTNSFTVTNLTATSASITTLTGTSANITTLSGTTATFTSATVTNLALTSLTLSNLSIASANITTLTSGSATITNLINSGGTANGVLYLNGSKVATSGSALTFDGTTFQLSRSSGDIVLNDTSGSTSIRFLTTGGVNYLQTGGSTSGTYAPLAFTNRGGTAEYMRLTDTGLGIGTTSPAAKLQVVQNQNTATGIWQSGASSSTTFTSDYASLALQNTNTTNNNYNTIGFLNDQGDLSAAIHGVYTSHTAGAQSGALAFGTRNAGTYAEKLRLDSSGNLGLGVTPSAWGGVLSKALEFSNGCYVTAFNTNATDSIYMGANNYYNGTNYIYKNSRAASRYQQIEGVHAWFTAPSGTAGNAITFTQAMTLDASGNLGVGLTNPSTFGKLAVKAAAGGDGISIIAGTNSSTTTGINIGTYEDGGYGTRIAGITNYSGSANTAMAFYTASGSSTPGERMRLTATGDLGINTTSPTAKLTISGNQSFPEKTAAYIGVDVATSSGNGGNLTVKAGGGSGAGNSSGNLFLASGRGNSSSSNGYIAFGISQSTNAVGLDTEYMRLDASGNLGIGTTSPAAQLHIVGSDTTDQVIIENTDAGAATAPDLVLYRNSASPAASDILGYLVFRGKDSAGNTQDYASIYAQITDPTSGTEDGALIFETALDASNVERARITAGGAFLVGATTQTNGEQFNVTGDTNGLYLAWFRQADTDPAGINIDYTNAAPNGTLNPFIGCTDTGGERFTARSNGGLANYSANNVNLASDERLKKDISPLATAWGKVKGMEVVNFRYKDCNEGDPLLYGVIAQQVQPIVPELVVVTREATETDPEYYGIREQPMYWLAIKALQEAMARIEQLEAKVAALEA